MQVYLQQESPANTVAIAKLLDEAVKQHQKVEFKAFVLFKPGDPAEAALVKLNVPGVGVASLQGEATEALKLYKISIDPRVKNTIILYRKRKAAETFVNLDCTQEAGRNKLLDAIARLSK
ncbi:hypothetical protein DYH09_30895 [bacterium CPR1]|nr:hypothetical protein [bacterium CPR1]